MRILLREPVLILPGDRFIIRMFSPVVTIGGGTVLDIAPPTRMKRADAVKRLREIESGSMDERLAIYVRESTHGLSAAEIVARTGWLQSEIDASARGAELLVFPQQQRYVDRAWAQARTAKIREMLKDFHRKHPLLPGMAKEEIRSRELAGAPAFLLDALLTQVRDVVSDGEVLRLASHKVMFQQDESAALEKIEAAFADAGLAVPSTAEVLAKAGVDPARAKSLLAILLKQQKLVKAADELLFHPTAIAKLKTIVASHKGEKFSVPEFKDWTGISRKYAIPLLELLDRERVTRREGDARVVL